METQTAAVASTFPELVNYAIGILNFCIPVIMAGALFFYFYNSGVHLFKAGGESKTEMKGQLMWGGLILFVMASVWGLVGFLENTFYSLR
jgi:hypothetical protein